MTKPISHPKKFTGYHATMIIIAFFAVVVGVNMVMARFALSTFGGTVVDNSYVASQKYNEWLAEARKQQAHGWTISPAARDEGKAALTITDVDGAGLQRATVIATAEHPVGRSDPFEIRFTETKPGKYVSRATIPEGRWTLKISVLREGKSMRLIRDIR